MPVSRPFIELLHMYLRSNRELMGKIGIIVALWRLPGFPTSVSRFPNMKRLFQL